MSLQPQKQSAIERFRLLEVLLRVKRVHGMSLISVHTDWVLQEQCSN